jgi:hypothetical protein
MALSFIAIITIFVRSYCLQFQTLRFYSASLLLLTFCMAAQGLVFLLDFDQLTAAAAACAILLLFIKTTIYMCIPLSSLSALSHV